MSHFKPVGIMVIVLAFLVAPSAASAERAAEEAANPEASAPPVNVLLTFRLGRLENGVRKDVKSYDLVVVSGGSGSKLLSGARVPFLTSGRSDSGDPPSFVYQNIGFSTEAHAWELADGRIKVLASLEDSRVSEQVADEPATVETSQLSIDAILTPGKPLEVTRVEGIRDRSGFVEVEAKVLR